MFNFTYNKFIVFRGSRLRCFIVNISLDSFLVPRLFDKVELDNSKKDLKTRKSKDRGGAAEVRDSEHIADASSLMSYIRHKGAR